MDVIPFLSLAYQHQTVESDIRKAITRVSDRNWFILGEEVKKFEQEYATFTGVGHCIAVGNGLDALTFALKSLDIQAGDEVIVPAHTYIATWLAVSKVRAQIVPVEPERYTFNIDVERIEAAITPRTRVILPVHLYGQSCDMTKISLLAEKYNLAVLEDNAQSHGSRWLDRNTGTFGIVNATSFYPTKNLGAWGDGGAVTTFSNDHAKFIQAERNYGSLVKNESLHQGSNSRLDEIQAAVLRVKLLWLTDWNEQRRSIANRYFENLQDVTEIKLPRSAKEAYHVYHQFVIRAESRNKLKDALHQSGIETLIHYPVPPFLQPAYAGLNLSADDFPETVAIAGDALSLPIWPGMETHQVDRVSDEIMKFYRSDHL